MTGEASAPSPSQQAFPPAAHRNRACRDDEVTPAPRIPRPPSRSRMRRISGLMLAVTMGLLGACGGWKRAGSNDAPPPSEGFTALLDQQALFKKLGRLSAGDPLPFTGSVAQVKASGDTLLVILGLSLE